MKKKIFSALTTALVVSAASTALAANPFVDVPRGHWAYNSVERLANEGIIEGYGDRTYRGDRLITRYEMAQMIARALARNPQLDGTSRAELNKLTAEFRDELDGFGVRVAELEKHSDMVKWTGEVRYRYWNDKTAGAKKNSNQLQVRLFPTAEVNEHWTAKARFTASDNMKSDSTSDLALTYVYAEGKYGNYTVNLGRMPLYSNVDEGMVVDDFFSGGQVTGKFDKITAGVNVGRVGSVGRADYVGVEAIYDTQDQLKFGAGFHYLKSDDLDRGKANIVTGGATYQINDDMKLNGAIAHNNKAYHKKFGYNVQFDYLGANRNEPGSWGAFAAYRYVGNQVGLAPTYDSYGQTQNKRGIDVGATYSPLRNTLTKVSYFHGKSFDGGTNKVWFARASVFF